MRLFHFSEDGGIRRFVPRPVRISAERRPGEEWLNGPLVWAIDEPHQPMYLFPRDCPRILAWPVAATAPADLERWWSNSAARMIAYVEREWLGDLREARLYRYLLPADPFVSLDDAGMWVSRQPVEPLAVEPVDRLAERLAAEGVDLRVVDSLAPLEPLLRSSLHVSAIRLRNSRSWGAP